MNFNLSDEQKQLADAIRRFVEKSYDFESRKKNIKTDAGYGEQAWGALVELGLTALPVPEAQGGFSGTAVDMMVVQQELGRGLVVEPYFATVVAAQALKLAGGQEALLEQVAGGELKLATAFNEPQARYELNNVTVTAKGGKLNGRKVVVIHGAQADKLVVSARTSGAQSDRDGISLFLVDTKGAGVSVKDYRTIDNLRAADVTFQDAPATLIGTEGKGWDVLEATADYAAVLLCAEAVGVMDTLNAATLEYAKTRQQFGVPIARFQALQHRMVEMFIHAEQSRSITLLAAARFDEASPKSAAATCPPPRRASAGSPLGGPGSRADPRRHGCDRRTAGRAHVQAAHADQHDLRRCGPPSGPLRQPAWLPGSCLMRKQTAPVTPSAVFSLEDLMSKMYFEDYVVGSEHPLGSYTSPKKRSSLRAPVRPATVPRRQGRGGAEHLRRLISSGWMTCGIIMRLLVLSMGDRSTSMGSPGVDEVRWIKPVYAGDTLTAVLRFWTCVRRAPSLTAAW
jgi:acyl-CoA dehydrogenase